MQKTWLSPLPRAVEFCSMPLPEWSLGKILRRERRERRERPDPPSADLATATAPSSASA